MNNREMQLKIDELEIELASEKNRRRALEIQVRKFEDVRYRNYQMQLEYETRKLNKAHEAAKKELENEFKKKEKEYQKRLEDQERVIEKLKHQMNLDGTTSGIPTSQTRINQKKIIPNSRKKSEKALGGQKGHRIHKLEKLKQEEITEEENHELRQCEYCGGKIKETGKEIIRDEIDYEMVVNKIRHKYQVYQCLKCGKEVHAEIRKDLKQEVQYGKEIKALVLNFINTGNISIHKIKRIIEGMSEGQINLSEGYISKLEKQNAKKLKEFNEELRKKIIQEKIVYWDDTVISINGKRGCLRFYGTDQYALYKAHAKKNKEGLDEDQVLSFLNAQNIVEHDHNKVNYNKEYNYQNAECNVHLLRELEMITRDMGHVWAGRLKKILIETNELRNKLIERGEKEFSEDFILGFQNEYEQIMIQACLEQEQDKKHYMSGKEKILIHRLMEYRGEYCLWIHDFEIPFSNNLSERSLRGIKTKMKVSGLFRNEETAKEYGRIKSYIETCKRHGINEHDALRRLTSDNPYTIKELQERF